MTEPHVPRPLDQRMREEEPLPRAGVVVGAMELGTF